MSARGGAYSPASFGIMAVTPRRVNHREANPERYRRFSARLRPLGLYLRADPSR